MNKNIENQYLYIQAKNHLNFTKEYINSLNNLELENINSLKFDDERFEIEVQIKKSEYFDIEIFVQSKDFDIRLYEKIVR